MKNRLIVAAALLSFAGSAGARAEATDKLKDVRKLKQEARSLQKQNEAMEKRLKRLEQQQARQEEKIDSKRATAPAQPLPESYLGLVTKGPIEVLADDGPICWKGICVFGALDAGLAWQSHGTPLNGAYPQGLEYAISKNSNRSVFGVAPGGMGYSGIGLKGEQEILPGFSGVFAVNTNFDPASGQLSNGPASLVQNNGVAAANQSSNGDSARAGQAFNDYAYLGVSSRDWGTLTFGRQRTLTTDDRLVYDPIPGSLAFSLLGYTGSLSSGDTENSRFDNSIKYRLNYGPVRFGAIYKFGGPGAGSPTNGATYQLSAGFDYAAFSFDAVYSHVSDAITLASLTAAQVPVQPANSLAGTISDNSAVLLSAKYSWNRFKFFGGYEYINYADPKDAIAAGFVDSNGYVVSVPNNTAYQYHDKILQLFWTGVKYAYDSHLDLSLGYYHELQNSYGKIGCNITIPTRTVTSTSTCSGTEDALGLVSEYHFNKRFEVYGGLMYSNVANGMASGFLAHNSVDPTVGLRYAF
jgi:predicted porin